MCSQSPICICATCQAKIKKLETLLKLSRAAKRHTAATKPDATGAHGAPEKNEMGWTADLMFEEILVGEDKRDDQVTIFGESEAQQLEQSSESTLLPADVFTGQAALDLSMHTAAHNLKVTGASVYPRVIF